MPLAPTNEVPPVWSPASVSPLVLKGCAQVRTHNPHRNCQDRDANIVGARLPSIGYDNFAWNVEQCQHKMACEAPACNNWHSPSEKRCRRFALVHKCEKEGCDDGLHVKAPDVSQVFVLDLTARSAVQEVRTLEASSATLRAQYIRIVVWGFCSVRSALLRKALQALPLVHELALPDREASAGVEMTIFNTIKGVWRSCPRLRFVIWSSDVKEALCDVRNDD
eukprot:CAMPEP_0115069872 /NCGR_PEP_ID=MMETSP0227-20121206/12799_1 /TAXON_ID=89957 /ORGANISM="Polarella glacialis, Strain CCMP 1383" /LENGTH=221 /DNA_ID=CAMNT_0002456323 /DNA_START=85 /DNA_END=750 /DNA_ORIENTATION=+